MTERKLGEAKYIRLYDDQLRKIDDYRAKKRPIPELSEVIRELIDKALE
jgi:hypothetical protein